MVKEPEYTYAGVMCECGSPLYKREHGNKFCKNCRKPAPKRNIK